MTERLSVTARRSGKEDSGDSGAEHFIRDRVHITSPDGVPGDEPHFTMIEYMV